MIGGAPVSLRDLTHTYPGPPPVDAVRDIDLEVAAGELVAILGPSGCGKSTLLRVLAGLTTPTAGHALVGDVVVDGHPGSVAYQPQRDLLMPWRRVLANATLGAEVAGVARADARAQAMELLGRFGLRGFEQAWPGTLSGGMRQRVALLRTFLVPRPVLLLDEPLGALDALTRREMQAWLQRIWDGDRRTVMLVTHDVAEAVLLADRVVVMSPRPGRIVCDLPVPLPRPRHAAKSLSRASWRSSASCCARSAPSVPAVPTKRAVAGADALARQDPVLRRALRQHGVPDLRRGRPRRSHFAELARMICYQQLAGKAAAAIHGRFAALFDGAPTPAAVLATPIETLRRAGLSGAKAASILDLADKVESGVVELDRVAKLPDDALIGELVLVRGIGEWTAHMFLMFQVGRLDVWPTGDLGVRYGYGRLYGWPKPPTPKVLYDEGEQFRPYRSLVAWWCWRAMDTVVPD